MNTIDWKKGQNNETKNNETKCEIDYINEMADAVNKLCEMLIDGSKMFDEKNFFSEVKSYITKKDRLLYTYISNFIFSKSEQEVGIIQTNLDKVIDYMFGEELKKDYEKEFREKRIRDIERTQRTVLKIWDHVNLARRQYILFTQKDDNYTRIVEEKMEYAETKILKDINAQLISLVAIFTALSFLIFGGISSLDNIFSGVLNIPILKLMIIGFIWCFCIMNLIYVFMFFIGKLTKLSIKSTEDINANLVQKYPLIFWSNFVIVGLFLLTSWFYFVKNQGYWNQLNFIILKYPTVITIAGFLIIIVFMGVVAKKLLENWKEKR